MRNFDLDQFWPVPPRPDATPVAPAAASMPASAETASAARDVIEAYEDIIPSDLPLYEQEATALQAAATEALVPEVLTPPPLPGQAAPLHAGEHGGAEEPSQPEASASEPVAAETQPLTSVAPNTDPATGAAAHALPAMPRKRIDKTPFVWAGLGFFAGVLSWHFIGFWSFVSNVVLNAHDDRRGAIMIASIEKPGLPGNAPVTAEAAPQPAPVPAAAVKSAQPALLCVALALDRAVGHVNKGTCPGDAASLRDAGFNRRSDRLAMRPRLQDPVAWSGTTAVEASPGVTGSIERTAPQVKAETEAPETNAGSDYGTLQPSDFTIEMDRN